MGAWSRIEGTPQEPDPNFAHALVTNESLFHPDGHLIPSVTVLGMICCQILLLIFERYVLDYSGFFIILVKLISFILLFDTF